MFYLLWIDDIIPSSKLHIDVVRKQYHSTDGVVFIHNGYSDSCTVFLFNDLI